jgi:hypothetical protein
MREAKNMKSPEGKKARPTSLSAESLQGLAEAKSAESEAVETEEESPQIDEGQTAKDLEKAEEEMVGRKDDPMFDFAGMAQQRNILASKERREKIEKTLEPMNIEDMVMKREIRQVIKVIPNKLHYTLRTFNQEEHLFCLQYVFEHGSSSNMHAEELLNTCKLVCSILSINDALFPEHRESPGNSDEKVDRDRFEKKLQTLSKLPVQMLGDLSIQTIWFNDRINNLFSLDNLKNG